MSWQHSEAWLVSTKKRTMKFWVLLALAFTAGLARAEEAAPLRWGEFGFHVKWDKPTYEIDSKYPFLAQLPTLDQFPDLLRLADDPAWTDEDKRILLSQLATLSRCDFTQSGLILINLKKEYAPAIERWGKWWDLIGKPMVAQMKMKGRTYPEAWKFVAWSPYLACPDYPLVLPEAWSFRVEFTSGDYGGVVKEIIMMRVWADGAGLERYYRVGWPQRAQWVAETWQGFDRDEAQFFMAALTYAIDSPWLCLREKITTLDDDGSFGGVPGLRHSWGHIAKRPKEWTNYYPGVRWSGVRDDQGRVIMNDDAKEWHTSMFGGVGETSLDEGIGVVYRLLLERYPDPSRDEELSRWKKRKITPRELTDLEPK
jgi:hypothetical protein